MNYPEHNRSSFYKYTSASTAAKILQSSSVIYRSPLQFNDPFDIQSGLHFDFDIDVLPEIILNRIEDLAARDDRPDVSVADSFGELVMRLWEMKGRVRFRGKTSENWLVLYWYF